MAGGARANSGPPPDPNALRRDRDGASWTYLPVGRDGPAPAWPLTRITGREQVCWDREWARPQAVMWERLGLEVEVALYVRNLVKGESRRAPTALGILIKQQQEGLGLSMAGLARQRWRIEAPEAAERAMTADDHDRGASAKTRFKTIAGGRTA